MTFLDSVVNRLSKIFFAAIVLSVAGCPEDKKTAVVVKPFEGQEIHLGVPAGMGFRTAWESPLNEWSAETGASAKIDELDLSDAAKPLVDVIAASQVQLALVPITRLGELIAAEGLSPIGEEARSETTLNWLDVFQGLRDGLCSSQKKPVAVPLVSPVLICYYRADLLEKAGLAPPQTWGEYQQLLDRREEWAPGLTAVEPWSPEFRATMFLARAVSHAKHPGHFSLYFDIETTEPQIESAAFTRALEEAKAALAKMPGDVLTMNPADCRQQFLEGKAALAIAFETGPGNPSTPFSPTESKPAEKKEGAASVQRPAEIVPGFCRLPGATETYDASRQKWEPIAGKNAQQVTLTGFAGMAAVVSSKSSPVQGEAAWNALARIHREGQSHAFPPGTNGLCRESQTLLASAWVGTELQGTEANKYVNAVAVSLRDSQLVGELPVVGHDEFRKALTEELSEVLQGQAEPQDALSTVGKKWRRIIKDIGRDKLRNSYRASLGLHLK